MNTGGDYGRRIKMAREVRGWNQTELATRAGVARSYISKLESNVYPSPSAAHLQRIADALGVSITDLTGPPAGMTGGLSEQAPLSVASGVIVPLRLAARSPACHRRSRVLAASPCGTGGRAA